MQGTETAPAELESPAEIELASARKLTAPVEWAERLRDALNLALDRRRDAGDNPRQIRRLARRTILIAANVNRARMDLPPYNARQIREAVRAVRHNRLVDAQTLRDAGFNEHNR